MNIKKVLVKAMCVLFMSIILFSFSYLFYRHGEFGNFYVEQEIYKESAATWVWHNGHIVTSRETDVSKATDSTFPDQLREVNAEIQQIKSASKFLK